MQKQPLVNGKIYNIIGIINLDKVNNWDYIKGTSLQGNVNFNEPKQINNIDHLSFSLKTLSLNMLGFSINLTDDHNKLIEFNRGETKISILNFKIEVFLK